MGLVLVASTVAVQVYFEKWRLLAMGVSSCGFGLGYFGFPRLVSLLVDRYGWKVALLIQAGIVLHLAVLGGLLRPLQKRNQPFQITCNSMKTQIKKALDYRILRNLLCVVFFLAVCIVYVAEYGIGLLMHEKVVVDLIWEDDEEKLDSLFLLIIVFNLTAKLCGAVSDQNSMRRPLIFAVAVSLAGLCTLILSFASGYKVYVVHAVLFGVFTGILKEEFQRSSFSQ